MKFKSLLKYWNHDKIDKTLILACYQGIYYAYN